MKPLPFAPISRQTFDAAALMHEHPPKFRNRNKQAVFEMAYPAGQPPAGTLVYTRWGAMKLPLALNASERIEIEARADVYDYRPTGSAGAPGREWHVNFADPHLFVAYASGLFAQDEMQVLEHPVLGSLKEALDASGLITLTVERDRPTPVLVRGVERRVAVATDPNAAEGRPMGLYGNRFAAAPPDAVRRATRVIDPPTLSNLIAVAAPVGGPGRYTRDEIEHVLATAYTGFAAAALETDEACGTGAGAVVHTGFWGCGAFGGNRTLMSMLQIVAARLAGVEGLVFHAFDSAGKARFDEARAILDREIAPVGKAVPVGELIGRVERMGFEWGVGDGN
jgi:hypothetical protein